MQFSTGGKAHEPQGMIRCNSEADSIVWMKEKRWCAFLKEMCRITIESPLWNENSRAFLFHKENMVTETKIWYGNIKTMENTESRS